VHTRDAVILYNGVKVGERIAGKAEGERHSMEEGWISGGK